jgi:hypothetical protein
MSATTAQDFERLVVSILEASGYRVESRESPGRWHDFVVISPDMVLGRLVVEVKFYRSEYADAGLVRVAAARIARVGYSQQTRCLLVVSSRLRGSTRKEIEDEFGVLIFDLGTLFALTVDKAELREGLINILEIREPERVRPDPREDLLFSPEAHPRPPILSSVDRRGSDLCTALRKVGVRKKDNGWVEYEELCYEIVKYLFKHDLVGFAQQFNAGSGLQRLDAICRIASEKVFWAFLAHDLCSRYIVFEFKNYAEKIGQAEILTTERYLFERASRKVAIIFCRKGKNKHADEVIRGAMREAGKLLLVLDDDDVCELLHMRERGEDPSDRLFEITDAFLMALTR